MQIIKGRLLISLAAETAALPGKPGVLGGKFPESSCRFKAVASHRTPKFPELQDRSGSDGLLTNA